MIPCTVGHVAPFFSPTAANEDQYALMYQSVSSCIVPSLYNAIFVLLSKFELPCWLTSCQPNRAVREKLLESIETALCKCSINPPEALLPLIEVFPSADVQDVTLLLPQLLDQSACTNLASVRHLVFVSEACLSAFFEGNAAADGGWAQAAGAFRVPELTLAVFREECACQAAHLTQLCYVLHCLPQCRCLEDERILLDQLADWVSQGRAGGESEPKLLLLWAKLLALSLRQLDFGSSPQALDNLLAKFLLNTGCLG
ncbi:hypothetical protein MRX96_006590 [Rhipicephalus microplus]